MKAIREFLARRAAAAARTRYQRGFDYATGELRKGTPEEVLDSQISAFDFNDFDRGMLDAMRTPTLGNGVTSTNRPA